MADELASSGTPKRGTPTGRRLREGLRVGWAVLAGLVHSATVVVGHRLRWSRLGVWWSSEGDRRR